MQRWNSRTLSASVRVIRNQCGYTMVELMVSITIALFLLGGLMTLVMHTRNTSTTQAQMQQLQDNERIAMTILTNVIQEAGYFPDPTTNTDSSLGGETDSQNITNGSVAFAVGQAVGGLPGSNYPGDTVAARFVSPIADSSAPTGVTANIVETCAGGNSNDTTATHYYSNVFQVQTVNGVSYLQCVLFKDGAWQSTVNLVPGLFSIKVWYGVSNASSMNVVQYVPASGSVVWGDVTSVKVRLYFQLPQYGFSGGQVNSAATSSAVTQGTQYVERVITLMNRAGVNT